MKPRSAIKTDLFAAQHHTQALDKLGTPWSRSKTASTSTLASLKRFPIDRLKIDRGFVAEIGRVPNGTVIPEAVVGLARLLGLESLAEGVEESSQGIFEKPVIPAKVGIQIVEFTGSPPSRGRRTKGFSRCSQLEFLRERGCPLGQGYYISRPMTAEAFVEWLKARTGGWRVVAKS